GCAPARGRALPRLLRQPAGCLCPACAGAGGDARPGAPRGTVKKGDSPHREPPYLPDRKAWLSEFKPSTVWTSDGSKNVLRPRPGLLEATLLGRLESRLILNATRIPMTPTSVKIMPAAKS